MEVARRSLVVQGQATISLRPPIKEDSRNSVGSRDNSKQPSAMKKEVPRSQDFTDRICCPALVGKPLSNTVSQILGCWPRADELLFASWSTIETSTLDALQRKELK